MRTPDSPLSYSELILRATPDAALFVDPDGIIRFWNAGAEALFGWPAAEAVGAPLDCIVPVALRAAHTACFAEVLSSGISRKGQDAVQMLLPAVDRQGTVQTLSFSIAVVPGAEGRPLGAASIIRPVLRDA